MSKTSIALLITVVAQAAVIFHLRHSIDTPDPRQPVFVSSSQRQAVLQVMRDNLVWLEHVFGNLRKSRKTGAWEISAATALCPETLNLVLAGRRSPEWIRIGAGMHRACHDLLSKLNGGASPEEVFRGLQTMTQSCVTCHSQFRLSELQNGR